MNHTTEPWWQIRNHAGAPTAAIAYGNQQGPHEIIAKTVGQRGDGLKMRRANADRIVACVNGCAGLDPAAYADVVRALGSVIEFCHAALDGTCHDDNLRYYERMAYAALDRADGYKHGDRTKEIKDA
jgi:hypothetical protein